MNHNTDEGKKKIREQWQEFEDTTKYGEFISSYFAWLTLDKQKENAKEMEKMTKENQKSE